MKRYTIIGIIISLVCLCYILRQADVFYLWSLLRQINPIYVAAVVAGYGLFLWLRAVRWQILLAAVYPCRLSQTFSATLIGYMANSILPARLGELVRVFMLNRLTAAPFTGVLATGVMERVFDGFAVVFFLFLALLFLEPAAPREGYGPEVLRGAGLSLLAFLVAVISLAWALRRWPRATISRFAGLISLFSATLGAKAARALERFVEGLAVLRSAGAMLLVVLLSLAIWGVFILICTIFLPALGLKLSLLWGTLVFLGITLAAIVPAAPGLIGTFQLGVYGALQMLGVDREKAVAYSLALWGVQYFPVVLAGLLEMWRLGFNLGNLMHRAEDYGAVGKKARGD